MYSVEDGKKHSTEVVYQCTMVMDKVATVGVAVSAGYNNKNRNTEPLLPMGCVHEKVTPSYAFTRTVGAVVPVVMAQARR